MLRRLAVPVLAIFAVSAFAAPPAATVASSESFLLRGKSVPVAGVPSWPVLPGDDIATMKAPALITFNDGSRVSLGEHSSARVEEKDGRLVFRLFTGFMLVTRSAGNSPAIFAQAKPVDVAPGVATKVSAGGGSVVTPQRGLVPPPPGTPPPISNR